MKNETTNDQQPCGRYINSISEPGKTHAELRTVPQKPRDTISTRTDITSMGMAEVNQENLRKIDPDRKAKEDDCTVDIGMVVSPGGQYSHVWMRPQDIRAYVEGLRAEIDRLKDELESVNKKPREWPDQGGQFT